MWQRLSMTANLPGSKYIEQSQHKIYNYLAASQYHHATVASLVIRDAAVANTTKEVDSKYVFSIILSTPANWRNTPTI
jgi:hypothetical protein